MEKGHLFEHSQVLACPAWSSPLEAEQPGSLWWFRTWCLRMSMHRHSRAVLGVPLASSAGAILLSRSGSTCARWQGSVTIPLLLRAVSLVCSVQQLSQLPCVSFAQRHSKSALTCARQWQVRAQLYGCFCEALLSWHLCLVLVFLL